MAVVHHYLLIILIKMQIGFLFNFFELFCCQQLLSYWQGVLVNSHAAGILADVCDRVCMMNHGKIMVSGTLEKLLATSKTRVEAQFSNATAASDFSVSQPTFPHRIQEPAGIEFLLEDSSRLHELIKAIMTAGGQLTTIAPVALTLDQFFVKVLAGQTGGNA